MTFRLFILSIFRPKLISLSTCFPNVLHFPVHVVLFNSNDTISTDLLAFLVRPDGMT